MTDSLSAEQNPNSSGIGSASVPESATSRATLSSKQQAIEAALRELVELKDYKDKYGKDLVYQRDQPSAWEKARAALAIPADETAPPSKQWVDEEGLRLFSQWLGMNYGEKVFGHHLERHARRIFSHATSVIVSRRSAPETLDVDQAFEAGWRVASDWADREDLLHDIGSAAYHADMTKALKSISRPAAKAVETPALQGTYACPICGRDTPHTHHNADYAIPALTDGQCRDVSNQLLALIDGWKGASLWDVREIDRVIQAVRAAEKASAPDPARCEKCGGYIDECGCHAQKTDERRKAPWPDFAGAPIYEGDTLVHPDGQRGRVLFLEGYENDAWRVDYGDGNQSRLCLQIGDKGRASVTDPRPAGACDYPGCLYQLGHSGAHSYTASES